MKKKFPDQLKLGWISYLNLFPLEHEIKQSLNESFNFTYGPPTTINKLLRENLVDLAPSSSICLLRDTPFFSLPIGVCSQKKVQSVYLGFKKEHLSFYQEIIFHKEKYKEKIEKLSNKMISSEAKAKSYLSLQNQSCLKNTPPIDFTNESATSVELSKILLTLTLGQATLQEMISTADRKRELSPVQLLIGDKALIEAKSFEKIIDLGEFWRALTKLPFVYAVWQSNKKIPEPLQNKILELTKLTQEKMHNSPSYYFQQLKTKQLNYQQKDLEIYWRSLSYLVGDKEKEGLMLFLELAKARLKNSSNK